MYIFLVRVWKVLVSLSLPYQEWLGRCCRAKHIVSIGKYFCWQIMCKISTHPTVSYSTFRNIIFPYVVPLFMYVCLFFVQMRVVKKIRNNGHSKSYRCSLICFKDLNIYSSYVVATWGTL